MPNTRAEHVAWCKERALAYLDDGEIANALASMLSDLNKHEETVAVGKVMGPLGLTNAIAANADEMRRWIVGFN